jgi:hypothetical protein
MNFPLIPAVTEPHKFYDFIPNFKIIHAGFFFDPCVFAECVVYSPNVWGYFWVLFCSFVLLYSHSG